MLDWNWHLLVPRQSHRNPVRWGTTVGVWTFSLCGSAALRWPFPCPIGLGHISMTRLVSGACWKPSGILLVPDRSTAEMLHRENAPPPHSSPAVCQKLELYQQPSPSQCHSSFKWPNVRKRSGPDSELCVWSPPGQVSSCSVSFDAGHVMVWCSSACIPQGALSSDPLDWDDNRVCRYSIIADVFSCTLVVSLISSSEIQNYSSGLFYSAARVADLDFQNEEEATASAASVSIS